MSDEWEVVWSQSAVKTMRKLDRPTRERIAKAAQLLSSNPHPPAAKHLAGTDGTFRIRTGDWRLLYTVRDRELIVLIAKVHYDRASTTSSSAIFAVRPSPEERPVSLRPIHGST